ncbi:hypothetical protein [Arthrobacter roseus]|uniref:hypothetical protein n=1 Tax=Arthrobacter roseus TaxID=136274 RepID=UPI001966872E|nr:hypothetical protein [Arthrobacter roseus]MBM7849642.1 AcrR family transcriptional regulator [Arthrobacter roseus]
MNPEPLNGRIDAALRQLTGRGARISITAVAAELGIPRSSLYRNAEARELIAQRITEERVNAGSNQAEEVHRLGVLIDALAGRVRNQEERLRQLEGRPNTTPR